MKIKQLLSITAALVLASGSALAAPVIPSYTSFGALNASFGGSGIPNDAVAIGQSGKITVGLTAHQRYGSPAVTNDGAGTFYAQSGTDPHAPSPANPYATWNFGFYSSGWATFTLYYDFDPAAGTDLSAHAKQGFFMFPQNDSWNLGMDFLASNASFDPTAAGEYTFKLVATKGGKEVTSAAIKVIVSDPAAVSVPEPGSLALAGVALLGLAASRRRKA